MAEEDHTEAWRQYYQQQAAQAPGWTSDQQAIWVAQQMAAHQQPQQQAWTAEQQAAWQQQQQHGEHHQQQTQVQATGHPVGCHCPDCMAAAQLQGHEGQQAAHHAPAQQMPAPAYQPPQYAAPQQPYAQLPQPPASLTGPAALQAMAAYQALANIQAAQAAFQQQQAAVIAAGGTPQQWNAVPRVNLAPHPVRPAPAPPPRRPPAPVVKVAEILKRPGRLKRPERLVVILRGLPGSGKSRVARTLRDIEVANGGEAPRVLSIDDYFMQETEVKKRDEETKKWVKVTEMQYVYEAEMEPTYRASALKAFKRTIDEGLYKFVVVDSPNVATADYKEFWSHAKTKGYEVYVFEVLAHVDKCAERNTHGRTKDEILASANLWEACPDYMIRLTGLDSVLKTDDLGEGDVDEVEMEHEDETADYGYNTVYPTVSSLEAHVQQVQNERGDGGAPGGNPPAPGSGGGAAGGKSKWDNDDDSDEEDDDKKKKAEGGATKGGGKAEKEGGQRKAGDDDDEEEEEGDNSNGLLSLMSAYSKKRVRWLDEEDASVAYEEKKQKLRDQQAAPISVFAQKLREEQRAFAEAMSKIRDGEARPEDEV